MTPGSVPSVIVQQQGLEVLASSCCEVVIVRTSAILIPIKQKCLHESSRLDAKLILLWHAVAGLVPVEYPRLQKAPCFGAKLILLLPVALFLLVEHNRLQQAPGLRTQVVLELAELLPASVSLMQRLYHLLAGG
eukprot:CAMPEP_0179260222 /NCGR_PEP_ID=MMETSP0797-20121207/26228_1 /TAXON_ID=47934 /ORGANISM="Dinophysis acuminata, Strain DAEP01" /LENGTH=133 /DNA_ID=CAMNT_0020968295 /DNA_START=87 /DNA_END=488 /DNA_ORIENTATION=+